MKPTLKWKRSNRQLFSSTKDKENPPTSSSSSAANTLPSFSVNNQLTSIQLSPSIAALAIPEIILSIAEYLNRSSLINCALVCRDWCTIFQPLLFRVIQASDFDRIGFAEAFHEHACFANSIEWIQESPIELPPPKKNTWQRIFRKKSPVKPLIFNRKPFEQLENSLIAGQTPALEKLSVRIQNQDPNLILRLPTNTVNNLQISTRGYPARKPRIYIEDILRAYPSLVSLTLEGLYTLATHLSEGDSGNSTPPSSGHFQVHTYLPQISAAGTLGSTASAAVTTATEISSPMSIQSPPVTSSGCGSVSVINTGKGKNKSVERASMIQTLKLRLVDISQDGLIAISTLLPRLHSLLIEEFLMPDMMIKIYRWTWSTEFITSLQTSFPHLRSLRLAFPFDNMKESTIVEILKAFPLLTTVGFRNSHFGKDALETLQEHCRFVECLDVSFGYANREFKGALIRFLQTWPRLRELEADGIIFHLDRPVDENVQRTPWACTNLEKLVCGFHGTDSMIFQHLSQFPKLSYLTISYPSINIFPVESTLAWMANCTRMEYFWFCQHRHLALDKSSIIWILNNWPNMKKLHVAGGVTQQKDNVKQWCKDAQRNSLIVEYDHHI
ncbi:hypothetical protein BGZ76_002098 [Entomortierella beljakovae]|nr:hypothetical protein BGZ76_002098 [Entomortierella beljakovae]